MLSLSDIAEAKMGFGGRNTSEEPVGETKMRAGLYNIMSASQSCAVFTRTTTLPN